MGAQSSGSTAVVAARAQARQPRGQRPGCYGPARMDKREQHARLAVYRSCVTLRCERSCAHCEHCRKVAPHSGWDQAPGSSPGTDPRRARLHGGDAFRYGDLRAWVAWARQNPKAVVELEGSIASLGGEDSDAVLQRLASAGVDELVVEVPTLDASRTAQLTGVAWDPERALDALATLRRTVAVSVALPINPATVDELAAIVRRCSERLGDDLDIVLRRAPDRRPPARRLPILDADAAPGSWGEAAALSAQIAALPVSLPHGARLFMEQDAYPPCVLDASVRRADLAPTHAHLGVPSRPLGALCDPCEWRLQCAWRPLPGAPLPPAQLVRPLSRDEALALQHDSTTGATHVPGAPRQRWDRATLDLPDLLCFAPWTSFAATEPIYHPVPCALSWVQTDVDTEEMSSALEISRAEAERLRDEGRARFDGHFHVLDNEALSLDDLWNGPLLRTMRAQMIDGGPSRHCRSMCRVVMGVEERATALLTRQESELTPAVVANRRLLVDEIRARGRVLKAKPLELVMGVAGRCNITCGFCDGPTEGYGELSDRRADEVIAWLPTLMSFAVSGPGEPLMSRNYLRLLQHVADGDYPSLSMAITTNGTLMTPAFLERHRRIRWSHVRFSLNAGSARTHETMTGKRLFDRLRENLDALCALRDGHDPPFDVTLSCVLSTMVMGDLHNFAKIVTDYRTRVVVEPMYGNQKDLSPWTRPELLRELKGELASVADAYALRNPPLAKAFRAVERFAQSRLDGGEFGKLAHH